MVGNKSLCLSSKCLANIKWIWMEIRTLLLRASTYPWMGCPMTRWRDLLQYPINLVDQLLWKMPKILIKMRGKEAIVIAEIISIWRCPLYHRALRVALEYKIWEQMGKRDRFWIQEWLQIWLLRTISNFLAVITKSKSLAHRSWVWMANRWCSSILTSPPVAQTLLMAEHKLKNNIL